MRNYFLIILLILLTLTVGCNVTPENQKDIHPEWVYDGVIYEVNTRQFTPEGTFKAFEEHLPRLKDMGVDILWFMPIQSIGEKDRKGTLGSYYSIKDYKEVNSEFGTLEDFKALVDKAHSMDMKVILDWVANHTSRDAVWDSSNPDWYMRDSLGNHVIKYDWTDIASLDYSKPDMREAMIDAMMFWLRETNIDGFRCDVAYEVPTDFWVEAKDSLIAFNSDLFFLAEAEEPELNETVFDAYYAWDFHHTMNSVAQGESNVDSLRQSLDRMMTRFPDHAIPMYFTSNHDENSWNGTEFERMGEAAESFAVLTYMLPGIPLIYNGQEAGFNRRLEFFEKDSIDWTNGSGFTGLYKSLNQLRKSNPALYSQEKGGEFAEVSNSKPHNVWSFTRTTNDNEVLSVFNFSAEEIEVKLEPEPTEGSLDDYRLFDFKNQNTSELLISDTESSVTITLSPWEYRVYFK